MSSRGKRAGYIVTPKRVVDAMHTGSVGQYAPHQPHVQTEGLPLNRAARRARRHGA